MGSLSIWHWLIVLVVVVLIFGTKKLRNLGGDVGGAVKGFKDAMNEEKSSAPATAAIASQAVNLDTTAKAPAKKRTPAAKKPAAKTAVAKPPAKKPAAKKPAATKATVAKKTSTAKPKASTAKKVES